VRRCLAKDPDERYQTIKDVAIELKEVRRELAEGGIDLTVSPAPRNETTIASVLRESTQSAGLIRDTLPATLSTRASSAEYLVTKIRRHRKSVVTGLCVLIVAAAGIGYWQFRSRQRVKSTAAFRTPQITQITSGDNTIHASISPDGKYVAHVEISFGQQSLWIKQVNAPNDIQIVPPTQGGFFGLTFSPDGTDLYYVFNATGVGVLYRVPALGGPPTKLLADIDSPVTFSPDGKRLAFVRGSIASKGESALLIANANGTGEQGLATRKLPESFSPIYFTGPSWSPDGKLIACVVASYEGGQHSDLMTFGVEDGSAKILNHQRWNYIGRVQWLPDANGLLMIAGDTARAASTATQIRYISYPDGETRNITNDLNGYRDLSLTSDATKLITVQMAARFTLWSMPVIDSTRAIQVNSGGTAVSSPAWTPDGKIVFSSAASGGPDIFIADTNGGTRTQLTNNLGSNYDVALSRDSRYIVFSSNRGGGKFNVWRMDSNGGNPFRLTNGVLEGQPAVSPDGRWVVFTSFDPSKPGVWKISIDGGEPVRLIENAVGAQVSPDGKLVACFLASDPNPAKLVIIPFVGGDPIKTFELQNTALSSSAVPTIRWSNDGRAIFYSSILNNVGNIWSQPVEGGKPTKVTDFKDSIIGGFDLSHDGKQIICSRGVLIRNAVLISEAQ
jgi:Tol biopolymer transport system component